MSVSKAAAVAVLAGLALLGCRREPPREPKETGAGKPRVAPAPDARSFAEPGEDAPISDLALDPTTHHLLALSRKGRRIGAAQIPTGIWSWTHKLSQQPSLVAVHPVTGEGLLVWQGASGGGLVTFRPTTGETLTTADFPALPPDPLQAHALDAERQRLYLAQSGSLACVDVAGGRLVAPRSGEQTLAFVQPLDLVVDSRRNLAILAHAGGGVTLLDLSTWGQYGGRIPTTEIPLEASPDGPPTAVAVDSEGGRAYVLHGREWVEISLQTQQVSRRAAFEPERVFGAARLALAPSCGRLYIASGDLVEVDLETGHWEAIISLDQRPSPIVYAPSLGALFTIHNGQIYSAYQRCPPSVAQ